MENLFGKTLTELQQLAEKQNWPAYTARQIAGWLYDRQVSSIDEMTNLSKKIREALKLDHHIELSPPKSVFSSVDGTKKYLFSLPGGYHVETAYIPEHSRHTLCVSSQVGCRMGCSFCMTAKQGFTRNLSTAEILNQVQSLPERNQLTNIVYMGMGEPLDNLEAVLNSLDILTSPYGYAFSPRRITVSTIGMLPALTRFLQNTRCNLAISLHSPFENERRFMVPMEKAWPMQDVLHEIRSFNLEKQRRVSFEYIVCKDWNHSIKHVNELARKLNGIKCRMNLISFHPIPGSHFRPPDKVDMDTFQAALNAKGIITTIRKSRGQDIQAACGLLSTLAMDGKAGKGLSAVRLQQKDIM